MIKDSKLTTSTTTKGDMMSLPEKHDAQKCRGFGKWFGEYNECLGCEREDACREATGDIGV
jgi:hypothetical protein